MARSRRVPRAPPTAARHATSVSDPQDSPSASETEIGISLFYSRLSSSNDAVVVAVPRTISLDV